MEFQSLKKQRRQVELTKNPKPNPKSNAKWGKGEERKENAHIVFFLYFYLRRWVYWSFDTKIIGSTKCIESKTSEKTELF